MYDAKCGRPQRGEGVDQMRTPVDRGVGKGVFSCGRPLWTTPRCTVGCGLDAEEWTSFVNNVNVYAETHILFLDNESHQWEGNLVVTNRHMLHEFILIHIIYL